MLCRSFRRIAKLGLRGCLCACAAFAATAHAANASGGSPPLSADLDANGVVEGDDLEFMVYLIEYWAALSPADAQAAALIADYDGDGDVDLADATGFETAFTMALGGLPGGGGAGLAGMALMGFGLDGGGSGPRADLDVDSDNDDGTGMPDLSDPEDNIEDDWDLPGKYVLRNLDDDNGNLVGDWLELGPIPEETGELVPLVLTIDPAPGVVPLAPALLGVGYEYKLIVPPAGASDLRIWRSAQRGNPANPNHFVPVVSSYGDAGVLQHGIWVLGDCNCDGQATYGDIDSFVAALGGQASYAQHDPDCPDGNYWTADANLDGRVTLADIDPFVALFSLPRRFVPQRLWLEGLPHEGGGTPSTKLSITAGVYQDDDIVPGSEDTVRVNLVADSAPCYDGLPGDFVPLLAVPQGYHCDAWKRSACFRPDDYQYDDAFYTTGGLNISLAVPLGPPDLPPRKVNPIESSLAFVSQEVAHSLGQMSKAQRPMVNDVVDLVTGLPLLQETDFELPFGGAIFRHIRTYSWPSEGHDQGVYCSVPQTYFLNNPTYANRFWDWNGRYWMMSENPILLVDIAKDYLRTGQFSEKRCYLILDAHHAIPFVWDPGLDEYVAPPWFDASMTSAAGTFAIRLARGSVTYTFAAVVDDLAGQYGAMHADGPHNDPLHDVHDPRPIGGAQAESQATRYPEDWGIPYYALLTRIEDRYGNRAEYTYCQHEQTECDDPSTIECVECCQNCREKGQLKAIRLFAAGAAQPSWTLLYVHRAFAPGMGSEVHRNGYQHALHGVYAYRGTVSVPPDCLTIAPEAFAGALDDDDLVTDPRVPPGWIKAARYAYSGPSYTCTGYAVAQQSTPGLRYMDALLLKTTVSERVEGGTESERFTVYRYAERPAPQGAGGTTCAYADLAENEGRELRAVYGDATIRRLLPALDAYEWDPDYVDGLDDPNCATVNAINKLLRLREDAPLTVAADGQPPDTRELIGFADMVFVIPATGLEDDDDATYRELAVEYLGSDLLRTYGGDYTLGGLIDRRPGYGNGGELRFYKFICKPDFVAPLPILDPNDHLGPDIHSGWGFELHYPYLEASCQKVMGDGWPDQQCPLQLIPKDHLYHFMIVDELDPNLPTDGQLISRRVVGMNAAGFVLSDEQYRFERDPSHPLLISRTGYREKRIYDEWMRLSKICSTGWSAADPQDQDEQGLVKVFKYAENTGDCEADWPLPASCKLGDLQAVGVQQGTAGPVYYLEYYERDPDRPDLLTAEVRFPEPMSEANLTAAAATAATRRETRYVFGEDEQILKKEIVDAPAPTSDGGVPRYRVQREQYSVQGQLEWQGAGSLASTSSFTAGDEFIVTHASYDPNTGELLSEVVDVDTNQVSHPAEFERQHPLSPLALTTTYDYDDQFGGLLKTVTRPDGSQTWILYKVDGDVIEQRVYENVIQPYPPDGTYRLKTPAKLNRFRGGSLDAAIEIEVTPGSYPPDGNEAYVELVATEPKYDANGHVLRVERTDQSGETVVSATLSYDGSGNVAREQAPDGTITRRTYDERGRLVKTYKGTADVDGFWTGGGTNAPDPFDNMVLVEKRYYGEGITDAGLLDYYREYGVRPGNQYFYVMPDPDHPDDPNYMLWYDGQQPTEDSGGWVTEIDYDWRMRPVWETRHSRLGDVVSQTATWYDNLDRVRFVAEYGPETPAGPDPRTAQPGQADPGDGAAFYTTAQHPLSLSETAYNARGEAAETRTWYWDTVAQVARYTTTATFYDHAGRPREVRAPNSPIQRYTTDAKGRQTLSETLVRNGTTETVLSRTIVHQYDDFDRALVIEHQERVSDTADAFVHTYTHNWYDKNGRLEATADFGTNQTTFSTTENAPTYGTSPAAYDANGALTACSSAGAPDAHCTCYTYDNEGRQTAVWHPDGTLSETVYDEVGRVILTSEGRVPGDPGAVVQRTAYKYALAAHGPGKLLMAMAAVLSAYPGPYTPDAIFACSDPNHVQVTEFDYAAPIYKMPGGPHGPYVPPDPMTWNWSLVSKVTYPNGQWLDFGYYVDGTVARRSDSRGNALRYEYDEQARLTKAYLETQTHYAGAAYEPTQRVTAAEFLYTPDGRLEGARSYSGTALLTTNTLAYDGYRNLLTEYQSHATTANSGMVTYTWDTAPYVPGNPNSNYNRLASIAYPQPAGIAAPTINLRYTGGAFTTALNALTSLDDSLGTELARYSYSGTGRRLGSSVGGGAGRVSQSFGVGPTTPGLDRFGRVTRLDYRSAADTTLHKYDYGYDRAGNRLFARVQQVGQDNTRSYLYGYDNLSRLTVAERGALNTTNDALLPTPTPATTDWLLDDLGNWTGGDAAYGSVVFDAGLPSQWSLHHDTDPANQLDSVTTLVGDDPNDAVTTGFVYDLAGNLVFDGDFFYQYDAFNRLVQVNAAGLLMAANFDAQGRPTVAAVPPGSPPGTPPTLPPPGMRAARYVYDALGRLAAVTRYDPQGQTQYEDCFYDGVRRLVEYERTPLGGVNAITRARAYVWGPGYVDELAAVKNVVSGAWAFALLDGNYNVMGLVNAAGAVVRQYVYEPYGDLVTVDNLSTVPPSKVGHQGLFFERFYTQPGDSVLQPALTAGKPGLCYNRARWYSPKLGRFVGQDMNATAALVLNAMAFTGQSLSLALSAFSPAGQFSDGMNLYLYAGANPVTRTDPLGLEWGMEGDIDDLINDRIGHAIAATGTIREGAKFAALGMNAAMGVVASLLPGSGLIDLYHSGSAIFSGEAGFWDYVAVVGVASPGVWKALEWGGKMAKASNLTRRLGTSFRRWFGLAGACNCFVAGTQVSTPAGEVPIEEVCEGDAVFTVPQEEVGGAVRVGRVSRVFRNVTPVMLWVTLAGGQVLGLTPTHRVWTIEDQWTYAGALEAGDTFLTIDGGSESVSDVTFDWTPTVTYNFEVEGTFTYFAEGVWVHNDSCDLIDHLHHVLPIFLGGAEDGVRVGLGGADHIRKGGFHPGLIMALTDAGIRRGALKWDQYFKKHPDQLTKAYQVLMNYTRKFDAKNGTSLVHSLWQQMAAQFKKWQ